MREKQLAVCDRDDQYLDMLQAYLLKKKPAGFEILVFGSVCQAVAASQEECHHCPQPQDFRTGNLSGGGSPCVLLPDSGGRRGRRNTLPYRSEGSGDSGKIPGTSRYHCHSGHG